MRPSLLLRLVFIFSLISWGALPVSATDCPPSNLYTVRAGDTLFAIAQRFGTTTADLIALNRLTNPNRIFVGQTLALPGCAPTTTATATPSATSPRSYIVQRGDTLSRIATRNGTTVTALVQVNNLSDAARIFVGQRLIIPDGATPLATLVPAPTPLAGLTLSPNPPQQGRTMFLALPASDLASASGALGPWPIRFFREGERFIGLVGIYALAAPGSYPLTLTLTDHAGQVTRIAQEVRVADGGYARETLTLSPEKSQLLDPNLVIPEREKVLSVVAPITTQRYWATVFQRPAVGRITSAFGTRRSYNGGPFDSFHGGTDFSARGGLDVFAPAPGVVVLAEALTVRGNATLIDHGWGVYSGFWHQEQIKVNVGDFVQAGQIIGRIGNTGLSTGAHLHWEMFVGGIQVDALQWLQRIEP